MDKERFLTTSAVADITTLSRSTIERKVRSGEMPSPVQLSARRKAWKESAIRQWMTEREVA